MSAEPPSKRMKIEEAFQLSEQQQRLIQEDTANKKLWDEAMGNLKEGPVGLLIDSTLAGMLFFLKVRADWLGWGLDLVVVEAVVESDLVGLSARVVEITP